ncbi:translation initiation factor IF-3 [Syntrophobacter fumaroxidans MPOB]|uniref:Translation initiation factor IF-3 n=1 Tax=Syntrophobacter fumaroxidans (strain DSM 10017 / MPOB) TaxID=335543 RepID=A0LFC3_SYNFM|nr:translation initiation factor IF-3 [Syntrophobacter fumaroxidans]ABK16125.1 translation initiation factor IF-3 [Syntrophobacter fumaroxidans MPOB]
MVLDKQVNVNERIRSSEVRVIGQDGQQLGVLSLKKALELAAQDELDLVEVAPNADPPVCKIMDYGKFKYQQNKRTQEAKKKQTVIQVKEVKIRPKTDEHDLLVKIRHIKRFLAQKDKAKVTILFRGREIAYTDQGTKVLERVREELKEDAVIEQPPKMEGRNMVMILAPKA